MKAVGRPQKWTKMCRSGRKSVGARYVKFEKFIRILMKIPLIWCMLGICGCNFRRVFLDLNEALFSCLRIAKYTHFVNVHFFTFGSISPSIVKLQKATIYQINANVIRIPQRLIVLL